MLRSSPEAIYQSLRRRRERLQGRLQKRLEELKRESHVSPRPPVTSVVGRLWNGCVFVFRNLYRLKEWGMTIRLVGQPPIGGTR